jgi:hypothetical protein
MGAISQKVCESVLYPGHWHFERILADGSVEVAIFSGPNAAARAQYYSDYWASVFTVQCT